MLGSGSGAAVVVWEVPPAKNLQARADVDVLNLIVDHGSAAAWNHDRREDGNGFTAQDRGRRIVDRDDARVRENLCVATETPDVTGCERRHF